MEMALVLLGLVFVVVAYVGFFAVASSLTIRWGSVVDKFYCTELNVAAKQTSSGEGGESVRTSLKRIGILFILTVLVIAGSFSLLFQVASSFESAIRDQMPEAKEVGVFFLVVLLWLLFLPVYFSMFKLASFSALPFWLNALPLPWLAGIILFYCGFLPAYCFAGGWDSTGFVVLHVLFHIIGWSLCASVIVQGWRSFSSADTLNGRTMLQVSVAEFLRYVPKGVAHGTVFEHAGSGSTTITYEIRRR